MNRRIADLEEADRERFEGTHFGCLALGLKSLELSSGEFSQVKAQAHQ